MNYSPLRYPGGKQKLAPFMEYLIKKTEHVGGTYIEPFAGGAGVALYLLERGVVNKIVINDYDKGIYSFWRAILTETSRFIDEIRTIPLTIEEWKKQKNICFTQNHKYSFELGFATFYLNRTNRSGIIKGGVIGGLGQNGSWLLDARFNKEKLISRIQQIATKKHKIVLYNKDIDSFLCHYVNKYDNSFIYFDPPYFNKGRGLYLNYFNYNDHVRIEKTIREITKSDWLITYDDASEISHLYTGMTIRKYNLDYCVVKRRTASELMIFPTENLCPTNAELMKNGINIRLRNLEETS